MTLRVPFHGGQLRQIADRFGIPAEGLLDFSANINPEGPPGAVIPTLRESLNDSSILTSYPDIDESVLKSAIAHYTKVNLENIAVANGFVSLLDAALNVFPIRRCLLPVPAFVEYRRTLARARVEVSTLAVTPESGFLYDMDAMLHGDHDAVLLANPQNPSGVLCNRENLLEFAAKALEQKIYILLDEAFIDFCSEASLTGEIERLPNLIVFRSVTKFFGMPGLRVSYAISNAQTVQNLENALAPWSITSLASLAACTALADEEYANRTRTLNQERRELLKNELELLRLSTASSAANFLLFRLPLPASAVSLWERMILDHQIVLRHCANYEFLPDGYFRAAVRNMEDNARLVTALREILTDG
jgi:threonine-phosphate decarboxylase